MTDGPQIPEEIAAKMKRYQTVNRPADPNLGFLINAARSVPGFDVEAFSRMGSGKQVATLHEMFGIPKRKKVAESKPTNER